MSNPSSSVNMDVDVPIKRSLDPDTKEDVSSNKKPRFDLDANIKKKCINFIAWSLYDITIILQVPTVQFTNISVGVQVANILFTQYSLLRQKGQEITSTLEEKVKRGSPTITVEGTNFSCTQDQVQTTIKEAAKSAGLTFDQEPAEGCIEGKKWFGICGPLMNFITGFGLRWRELRLGHGEMPFKKEGKNQSVYPVSKFGLSRGHHILLEGVRFPPERRSSMVQSLGPMTQLLCYLLSAEKYEGKFKIAVLRSFAHFPNIEGILKLIKGRPYSSISNIVTLLADLSIICTTRNAMRCFPPPTVFMFAFTDMNRYTYEDKATADFKKWMETYLKIDVGKALLKDTINFSGLPAFALYHFASKVEWSINTKMTSEEASQMVFHSWFGTYKEDLSILSQMTTTQNWFKRDQIKDKFTEANTKGSRVTLHLPTLTHYSKMASASQTGEMSQGYRQLASIPVFSGVRVRKFANDFFKYLEENTPNAVAVGSIQSVEADLSNLLNQLVRRLKEKGGEQDAGTTQWFNITNNLSARVLRKENQPIPDNSFKPRERGIYFLSPSDQ